MVRFVGASLRDGHIEQTFRGDVAGSARALYLVAEGAGSVA